MVLARRHPPFFFGCLVRAGSCLYCSSKRSGGGNLTKCIHYHILLPHNILLFPLIYLGFMSESMQTSSSGNSCIILAKKDVVFVN
jgi:hypothetical protein